MELRQNWQIPPWCCLGRQPRNPEHVEEGIHPRILQGQEIHELILHTNQGFSFGIWTKDVRQGEILVLNEKFADPVTLYFIFETISSLRPKIINFLMLQGAPEGVLDRCSHVRIGNTKVPMTSAMMNKIFETTKIYGTGRDTLRCLALATCDNPPKPEEMDLADSTKFAQYEVCILDFQ